jgi:hypothetical protein
MCRRNSGCRPPLGKIVSAPPPTPPATGAASQRQPPLQARLGGARGTPDLPYRLVATDYERQRRLSKES